MNKRVRRILPALAAAGLIVAGTSDASASSHMDAPLIVLDDAANTTDVYAFVREQNGRKSLVTALGVYPFEEPGIGPNKYNFDDNVLYDIHVALGKDVAAGRPTLYVRVPLHDAVQEPPARSCSPTSASSTT